MDKATQDFIDHHIKNYSNDNTRTGDFARAMKTLQEEVERLRGLIQQLEVHVNNKGMQWPERQALIGFIAEARVGDE